MIVSVKKRRIVMPLPTIKTSDFFKNLALYSVVFYQDQQSLKKQVSKTPLALMTDHLSHTQQLCQKKDPVVAVMITHQTTIIPVYFVYIEKKASSNSIRNTSATLARLARKKTHFNLSFGFAMSIQAQQIQWICEGFYLGDYRFSGQKQTVDSDQKKEFALSLYIPKTKDFSSAIHVGTTLALAQNMARDLANTPANHLTPKAFVDTIKESAKQTSLSVKVHDKKFAHKHQMGAFLAVAQGSVEEPYILEITLNPSSQPPIILVGKGVTFDTGGISIKPSMSMALMKGDMSGAAAVAGAMTALAKMPIKTHVKAIIPLVENMPSGSAYKPGDVVQAMNKKSIEIINTDAEGRLILADALCLATTYKPRLIIDIATLTGACSVALGNVASAILGNPQKEVTAFLKRQEDVGEKLWQLPLYEEYQDYLESSVADVKHCAENRFAGTATAATFLQYFVDNIPWIHLDIASTMENKSSKGYCVKGMSGSGTRTLIQAVLDSH